jgi:hypothetical protein
MRNFLAKVRVERLPRTAPQNRLVGQLISSIRNLRGTAMFRLTSFQRGMIFALGCVSLVVSYIMWGKHGDYALSTLHLALGLLFLAASYSSKTRLRAIQQDARLFRRLLKAADSASKWEQIVEVIMTHQGQLDLRRRLHILLDYSSSKERK